MEGNTPGPQNPRSVRIALVGMLLLSPCWRLDRALFAAAPAAPDRYQLAANPERQAGGATLPGQGLPDHGPGLSAPVRANGGTIHGLVVNGSREQLAVSATEVALRARLQGQFDVAQITTTDARGRFQFLHLPLDAGIQYVPGANCGEIHYPGPRLILSAENPDAQVKIVVYEPSQGPNPLVLEQHDIFVRPRTGVLEVTESMVIHNPAKRSFVGQPVPGSQRNGTLQLAIPSNFERVTFEKEFYGRRFSLMNGKLLTDIPWPPGRRRLKFTYVLPREKGPVVWQRPVDLPCSLLKLTVATDKPDEVRCNLEAERLGTDHQVTFTSSGGPLPVGQQICLRLGPAAVPLMVYGRWTALALLGVLVGGTGAGLLRARRVNRDESLSR